MTIPRQTFDAATAPLHKGVNLVEASAGTGKTFAIAMLVLRFVTEFGFPLQNILVVTFTKAATEELKERIRARLASAREMLANCQSPAIGDRRDPALESWRAGLTERGIPVRLALQRLEMALLDMDLAPVFTIHGFCQRMLQEQALESGQLFDFELTKDISRQQTQVIEDYWRRNIYPLSPLHCALITSNYPTPHALFKSVQGGEKRAARILPQALTGEDALTLVDQSLSLLSDWWRTKAATLHGHLQDALNEGKFTKKLADNFSDWWQQLDDFLCQSSLQPPNSLDFLTTSRIMEALNGHKFRSGGGQSSEEKKQAFISTLPLPEQELSDFLQAWQGVTLAFRMGLIRELATGLNQTLRRQHLLSFDDLILQLEKALLSRQGPGLRQIISKRYQAALIDEFQDTDDSQYTIFSTLFAGQGRPSVAGTMDGAGVTAGQGRPSVAGTMDGAGVTAGQGRPSVAGTMDGAGATAGSAHYLYLIGDPKQAIYTFRGADIYSYFKARAQADIHLNLAKNFRSHPALVEAVNRLFQLRENAFAAVELPYFPVMAAKSADDGQLLDDGKKMPVMVYCQLDTAPDSKNGRWSSGKATQRIVSSVISEIARLLRSSNPIMLSTTVENKPALTPLAPSDIAILVRSHKQAEQFQLALARIGIPAVTASQQSVFATSECHDLCLLMLALSSPGDLMLLKTALTSCWFDLNGPEFHAFWQDQEQVDQWLVRAHDYHKLWREQGFLAMMTRLLASEKILLRLSRKPLAERRISNIHHLLELIQTAETEQAMGPAKTLQWLRSMQEDQGGMEDTELRLESDEEAVKIVTMHGAKGLEYPVVFCPFLWYRSNYLKQGKGVVSCHDENKELIMDLGSPLLEEHKQQALQEELAEELRLAYVALTRARCRCYVFWADVSGNKYVADSRDSSLAWLLCLEQEYSSAEQVKILQDLAGDGSVACELISAEIDAPMMMAARNERAEELVSLTFTASNLHTDWLLHSYSSLAAQHENQASWLDMSAKMGISEADETPLLPDLPKGAQMGNVVHGLLEDISFSALAVGSGYEETLKQQCAWFGVEVSPTKLAALLQKVVQTPLTPAGAGTTFCLADLDPSEVIREMPFYFHLQPSATGRINSILAGSRAVVPITPKSLQGYLTGFVDLICRYQGRFYIMDYKSNWLGNHLPDYGAEALEQAMRDHNYGLQYWFYTLVLHRYLQNALENYAYDTHFGGVIYLFVRGMEPTVAGSGVYFDLPDLTTLERLDHCLGRDPDTEPSMASDYSYGGSKNG
ncbi:MAG: UvrD-helicase domain-containing protein [Desulfoarculaceae bacterium]|nr:UvrD-helicase domain-containing protein [Desulfoarculaceae bacterium]